MDLLNKIWNDFVDFFYSIIISLVDMLKDLFFWLYETVTDALLVLVNSLSDIFDIFDITSYLSALPADTLNIMGLIGIDTISSMIVSCLLVRFILQLIPFVRLGS